MHAPQSQSASDLQLSRSQKSLGPPQRKFVGQTAPSLQRLERQWVGVEASASHASSGPQLISPRSQSGGAQPCPLARAGSQTLPVGQA
jgi:hypothetical protein